MVSKYGTGSLRVTVIPASEFFLAGTFTEIKSSLIYISFVSYPISFKRKESNHS